VACDEERKRCYCSRDSPHIALLLEFSGTTVGVGRATLKVGLGSARSSVAQTSCIFFREPQEKGKANLPLHFHHDERSLSFQTLPSFIVLQVSSLDRIHARNTWHERVHAFLARVYSWKFHSTRLYSLRWQRLVTSTELGRCPFRSEKSFIDYGT